MTQKMQAILNKYTKPVKEQFIYLLINETCLTQNKASELIKKKYVYYEEDEFFSGWFWEFNTLLNLSEEELIDLWNSLEKR